jgi:phage tail sheath protein FI
MLSSDTPGVYYQRADVSAPVVSAIRTDVAGFVGIASRGLVDVAMPIESWRQFQAHYGGFTGSGFLAYAVRGFFENGGGRCWIVRVASNDPLLGATTAGVILRSATRVVWRLAASSPGVWGNDLTYQWRETHAAQTVILPRWQNPAVTEVASITGFVRGSLVRLRQPGIQVLRVVSAVDAVNNSLIWQNPRFDLRLPYDQELSGLDADRPTMVESIEYTLAVRELGIPVAVYTGLSVIPEHPAYAPQRLGPLTSYEKMTTHGLVLPPTPEPVTIIELRPKSVLLSFDVIVESSGPLAGGNDGLALLEPYDFMGEDVDPSATFEEKALKTRGFRALDQVDEVTMIAVPDIHIRPYAPPLVSPPTCVPDPCLPGPETVAPAPPTSLGDLPPLFTDNQVFEVESALVDHCELMADRIAILDPPSSVSRNDQFGIGALTAWRARFDSTFATLHYPWLRVVDPLRHSSSATRDIPPSGHVAGQFAAADFTVGVHKAPANVELTWVQDVTVAVNESWHGLLNSSGINAIRVIPGRGIRILGARTLSINPDWRYINVRRLLIMIEKALRLSIQWAVFEPNTANTRGKLRLSIVSFLLSLWQRGALMGDTADAAFRVKCDDENNPPADRDFGRLLAQVLVAPSQPFEFVEVRLGRQDNEFEIQELAAFQSPALQEAR